MGPSGILVILSSSLFPVLTTYEWARMYEYESNISRMIDIYE